MEGNAKFQLEISEHKDVIFPQPSSWAPWILSVNSMNSYCEFIFWAPAENSHFPYETLRNYHTSIWVFPYAELFQHLFI